MLSIVEWMINKIKINNSPTQPIPWRMFARVFQAVGSEHLFHQ